ncbi:MAG: serine hydrolase domain-containing protein [Cyanobacteria bacterium P01_G01_bin.54]
MVNRLHHALALGLTLTGLFGGCTLLPDASQAESIALGQATLTPADRAELAAVFADTLAAAQVELDVPGMAVALVYQDQILLLEGWGYRDLERELPVTLHTRFHIGSTHKSMTALLGAIAVDRGLLTWDDPVVTVAPEFELSDSEATATVSLRHLLSMRSGISDDVVDERMQARFSTPSLHDVAIANVSVLELFSLVSQSELLGAPGEVFDYSNVAIALAGYLTMFAAVDHWDDPRVEYETLLQDWILEPIGMADAVLQWSDAQASGDVALPYVRAEDAVREEDCSGRCTQRNRWVVAEREDLDQDLLAPAGGLKASITDMAAYMITQVQGGIAPNGQRVVSRENLTATWQPRWGNYAMGWEQFNHRGVQLLSHTGSFDNFFTVIGMLPEYELGFVVLTNSDEAAAWQIPNVDFLVVDLLLELE